MDNKLYVGNLPYTMRDEDLREHFARFGEVASAKVMTDRETGRSKGFAFVEMASGEDARSAISGMHGQSFGGRALAHQVGFVGAGVGCGKRGAVHGELIPLLRNALANA